jgi:hypothetical protein
MAGCGEKSRLGPRLAGHFLSLLDEKDTIAGSCRPLFNQKHGLAAKEIQLQVGQGHGTFYRPLPEWLDPLAAWALAR